MVMTPQWPLPDRFDFAFTKFRNLAGGEHVGFNNAVFLSERQAADRNFALAYFMRENDCFPTACSMEDTLDFYFQLCSLEATCESAAVMAATLANGGICPLTEEPVLDPAAVRNTLCLMFSCGMYDYSGQFAFKCGVPAKSGISGVVLVVVPNVMGIALYSPPLDASGNSVRGVRFCKELVEHFNFHQFDNDASDGEKLDPRTTLAEKRADLVQRLMFAASAGDTTALRRFRLLEIDLSVTDYDERTALHLAAAEGRLKAVKFLLDTCQQKVDPKDRWGRTPLDDAIYSGKTEVVRVLLKRYKKLNLPHPMLTAAAGTATAVESPLNVLVALQEAYLQPQQTGGPGGREGERAGVGTENRAGDVTSSGIHQSQADPEHRAASAILPAAARPHQPTIATEMGVERAAKHPTGDVPDLTPQQAPSERPDDPVPASGDTGRLVTETAVATDGGHSPRAER
ncbi:glutaminase kidney isoform, mitochondrial-like [Pollicipes pollicipes]|uniref:glutaminase kidney isoform, mitochondrial-like n=1 Tax=Pollicipes pollicipes TaxID=41117 RepID=UPI0018858592|nr:glutaminase kidney isoform, mitochondrial-like [Pollicipes pollicipes]